MRVVKPWNMSRKVVDAPSMEMIKVRLDEQRDPAEDGPAPCRWVGLDDLQRPLQPKLF